MMQKQNLLHGCDIRFFRKNVANPKIYSKTTRAYRPGSMTVAIETDSGLRILLRATGGPKYQFVDEWRFLPDFDDENHPGRYHDYTLRGPNTAPTNRRGRLEGSGKPVWIRVASHKIEDSHEHIGDKARGCP
jgi:hypothetical protein